MSIQSLINSIQIALLRAGPSKIAVHSQEEREIGERAVARAGRSSEDIDFLVMPPHLHALLPSGTFLGEEAGEAEADALNNLQGIQVVFVGRKEG